MSTPKFIVIDGISFCRDDSTGYYLNGTIGVRAHRYVYAKKHGPIPPGYHVHHKDEDKSNNEIDNLELMFGTDHFTYHGQKNADDPDWLAWSRENMRVNACHAAAEWHRSPEGREWHSKHAKQIAQTRESSDFKCEQCAASFRAIDNGRVKFCSNACKSAWRRGSGVDNVTRVCECCGAEYERNKYAKTRTCSKSCANRLRHRAKRHRGTEP
jgi:hypothetical protein